MCRRHKEANERKRIDRLQEQAKRRDDLRKRLAEKAKADPGGIWGDLLEYIGTRC